IRDESEVGKGSCFTVSLPYAAGAKRQEEEVKLGLLSTPPLEVKPSALRKNGKDVILLVEDNEDLRFYLKDNLKSCFNVLEAPDGASGFQLTLEARPDVVVSDIIMPGMSGMELCRKIRSEE